MVVIIIILVFTLLFILIRTFDNKNECFGEAIEYTNAPIVSAIEETDMPSKKVSNEVSCTCCGKRLDRRASVCSTCGTETHYVPAPVSKKADIDLWSK